MAKIYLVRHGETAWNRDGRYQGALDSQLTERGIEQAHRIGKILAKHAADLGAAYASPLGRARQTHAIIASYLEPLPVHYDDQWPGGLDGSTQFDWYFRSPDGESHHAAQTRAWDWLSHVDGVVLAVSHGLFGRLIRGIYLGLPPDGALSLPVQQDVVWVLEHGRVGTLVADT